MATLDTTRTKVRPRATAGVQRQAFTAEARALQRQGRAVKEFGGKVASLAERVELLDAQNDIDQASLDFDTMQDKAFSDRRGNPDLAGHRKQWDTDSEAWINERISSVRSKKAQDALRISLGRRRLAEGTRIEVDAFRRAGMEARARFAQKLQSVVEEGLDEPGSEMQEETLKRFAADLKVLIKAGHFTESDAVDAQKTLAIMTVQTAAERWPQAVVETLSGEGAALDLILTDDQIKMLTAEDLDDLQADAQRELKAQQSDVKNRIKEQNEKLARDIQAKIVDPTIPIAKTQTEYLTAVRNGNLERTQISGLGAAIKSRISNAGKTADPEAIAISTDEYENLEENGKLDEAHAVALRDAWMHTEAVTRGRLEEIAKARANPSKESTDPNLKEFIDISNKMESNMLTVLKAQTDEEELKQAGRKEFRRSTATLGLNRLNRNAKIRDIYSRTDIDEKKKRELAQEIVLPAQQEAAKAVTKSIWGRAFDFQRRFTPFGAVEGIISTLLPGKVRVRKPDGTIGTVSKKNLKEAQEAGFTVID